MTADTPPLPEPGARIALASVPNLRDLGGWPAAGGHVRRGVVYRSSALHRLTHADAVALAALGVRTVFDLRSEQERRPHPDRLPSGAHVTHLDVFAGPTDPVMEEVEALGPDAAQAWEDLDAATVVHVFENVYRGLVSRPGARRAYGRLFAALSEPAGRPALIHCAVGKDRTGWAAAALLLFLGVPEDLVLREYLVTNRDLFPEEQRLLDGVRALGGHPDLLEPLIVLRPGYLEAALDEARTVYGDIEGYLGDGLGLDRAARAALRAALIEPD